MKQTVEADIAIIGGGIAGLWLLNELRQKNYSVILLESGTLGGEQTHKSQGIIHGGMKYALQGEITAAASTIAHMPRIWLDCLNGSGRIDLRNTPILSTHQYLWTTGALTSTLAGYFASLMLKGNVLALKKPEFPAVFQHAKFKGNVYSLDEIVVDVHALIRELVKPNQDVIFKIDPPENDQFKFAADNQLESIELRADPMTPLQLKAKKYIFTAGSGNHLLLKNIKTNTDMQLRPLHMVIVKHDQPYEVYAHCLGRSALPRVTITTHQTADGKYAWYLGGQIAEEGIKRDAREQISAARKELTALFPWLNFSKAQFATFFVDRAEPKQADGKRPDSCFMQEIGNTIVAWPTKLAFAPMLSEQIIQSLQQGNLTLGKADFRELRAWPMPAFAKPLWDQMQ